MQILSQMNKTTPPTYAANRILSDLGITSIDDLQRLELIALQRGAVVRYHELKGAEARIVIAGRKAIITISSSVYNTQRRRFCIAHELGHFELHRWRNSLALCTPDDIDIGRSKNVQHDQEQEANVFASSLLLPERFFAGKCDETTPSLDHIAALANEFNTSLTATALRYLQFTPEPCAIVLSTAGLIKWYQRSALFKEMELFIETRVRLDPRTRAFSFFNNGHTSKRQLSVPASAWLADNRRIRKDLTLVEQSWPMPNYNSVISLLWLNEALDEDDFW